MPLMMNGKQIPPGWPPDGSQNSMQWSGMDPEVARTAAWIGYLGRQEAAKAGPGNLTQAAAGIDPATGKPIPTGAPPSENQKAVSAQTQGTNMPTGPTVYDPSGPGYTRQQTGSDISLMDYLTQKLGPMKGYSITTPLNPQANTTQIVHGGGGGGGDLGSIIAALKASQDKANAANEARYAQANAYLSGYGKSFKRDINETARQDAARTEQDAISRGIGNTTIRNSLLQGVQNTRNKALLDLRDRLTAQRVGLLQSKYDNAPDPMAFASLLQGAAQGAYGSGGTLSSIAAALGLLK